MSHAGEGSRRGIFYALRANFGIAVAKSVAAVWAGSGSMLAEAIHSVADCANQLLLLLGMKQARRRQRRLSAGPPSRHLLLVDDRGVAVVLHGWRLFGL